VRLFLISLLYLGSISYVNCSGQQLACLWAMEREFALAKAESSTKQKALSCEKKIAEAIELSIEKLKKESASCIRLKDEIEQGNGKASEPQKKLADKLLESYRVYKEEKDDNVGKEVLIGISAVVVVINCIVFIRECFVR